MLFWDCDGNVIFRVQRGRFGKAIDCFANVIFGLWWQCYFPGPKGEVREGDWLFCKCYFRTVMAMLFSRSKGGGSGRRLTVLQMLFLDCDGNVIFQVQRGRFGKAIDCFANVIFGLWWQCYFPVVEMYLPSTYSQNDFAGNASYFQYLTHNIFIFQQGHSLIRWKEFPGSR